jgi:hypothetical protein
MAAEVKVPNLQIQLWVIIAGYLSWTTHHSFGWCIFQGVCNIFYIMYWLWNNSIT